VRFPGPAGRLAVTGAAAVWAGTALGLHLGVIIIVPVLSVALALWLGRRATLAIFVMLAAGGVLSGAMAASRIEATWDAEVPEGPVTVIGRVAEDGRGSRPGIVVPDSLVVGEDPLPWAGPALAVGLAEGLELVAGERVLIEGILRPAPGRVRGDPVAGRLAAGRVERVGTAGPLFAVGNALRARVESATSGDGAGRALLSGFLIGDTSQLPAGNLDALRRSGLTHFVAVSGSNVALFLAGWWMVTALFGIGSRRRFVLGLVGLAVFVVVTRWEGSVLRAATMAGFLLGGSAAGVAVDGWMALGAAVCVLLLASGHLALDVGFQLSVAATAGIMLGAGLGAGRSPRWAWTVLAATLSAQLSVLPILLWHFGSVPLLSPLANLMAAPLVSAATITGALGVVTGWAPLIDAASGLAGLVLAISHLAAAWPQLGTGAVLLMTALGGLVAFRRLRPWLAVGAALALGAAMLGVGITPSGSTVTVLDIGQGDAVLLRSEGAVALIDGGRDPLLLAQKLRTHGVGRIDLLVVTHGDIDHVGGLDGILGDHGVGALWVPAHGDPGAVLERLVAEAVAVGVIVERVDARSPPGTIGNITLRPMGPMRRYAADNDVSIVLWVEARRTLLLAGDVEAVAQRELPALRPDVLLVPHHGSATTDIEWLAETLGETAVVSVGENVYGHPAPEIMTVLEEEGVELFVTQTDGDVTIRLG
jgi:competence protein ComEC